jgi:hypothetical protein
MKNPERRIKLSNLIKKKMESLGMSQEAFCNWITETTGLAGLTYGALQAWEDPKRSGNLPNCDNFYALSKVFETTMDDLYAYLSDDTNPKAVGIDNTFEEEKLKRKVLSMPQTFQKELMLAIQSDLLGAA